MHRDVETLIGRLVTDPQLLHRFAQEPARFLAQASGQGLELTPVEREALAALDLEALRSFAASLDGRLRKAASANSTVMAQRLPRTRTPGRWSRA